MAQPLREEFHDAVYHVTARGGREGIFMNDSDRRLFLVVVESQVQKFFAENSCANGARSVA